MPISPYAPGGDIFQTGADTRFNSFVDPSAMAMASRGGGGGQWGIDPNQLTPAYTAAYRPTQNINQGNPFGGPAPGFGQSVNQLFNPFAAGGTNYGGNTYQQQSPYWDTLGYNPLDRTASIAQNWVIPGVASWVAFKYLSKPLGDMGARLASGMATGMARGTFSAGTTATMGRMAGGLGRIAGALAGPMVAAEMGVWAVDKAVFDPYVAQRQTSNDLRRNFAGVTFGGGVGNELTGKGFSRTEAGRQAAQISVMGAQDYSFNQSEVSKLTDLSARAGLLDTVQGGQIAERMRAITKQVKMVMQIGNTSDFKEAIEILSKLQTSGVGTKDVTAVVSKLGGMASVAGVSLQKMMATVGAQGEYMFAASGLNPYAGQLAAAGAYGAFSVAQRRGLLSSAALARMGGVEGATQSATGALLGMALTPYSGMAAYNKYLGGEGETGGVTGTVSKFGAAMAQGPLAAYGKFEYTRGELASRSLEEEGQRGQMDRLTEIARVIPGAMKDGKIDAYAAYPMLMSTMGLSADQARAFIERQKIAQDPEAARQSKQAIGSAWRERKLKYMEEEGRGSIFSPITRPVNLLFNAAQESTSRQIGQLKHTVDSTIDALEKVYYGRALKDISPLEEGESEKVLNLEFNVFEDMKRGIVSEKFVGGSGELYEAARNLERNSDVIKAIEDGDMDALRIAISYAAGKDIDDKWYKPENKEKLARLLMSQGTTTAKDKDRLTLEKVTKTSTKENAGKVMELGKRIYERGGKATQKDINEYNALVDADSQIKEGDTRQLLGNLAKTGRAFSGVAEEGGISGWLQEQLGTAEKGFMGEWGLAEDKREKQKQIQELDKGLGGQMDFSEMNKTMGLMSGTIDPNGSMRVTIVEDKSGKSYDMGGGKRMERYEWNPFRSEEIIDVGKN